VRKTLMQFVRDHRSELDAVLRRTGRTCRFLDDVIRRKHVLTDADLHRWARAEGVQI